MSDYNLGTARGVIEIEYRGDGAKQASRDLQGAGSSAEDANRRLGKAGTVLAGTGLVIAAGLGLAAKSAADFEKQLSNVAAVSGATEAEMEQVRAKALQLGKDTQFSAAESASAIEELVKAGLSVQDVMNGAADATVNLAAAGEVSMPEAATIASNAMNQFNLAAEDMVDVADNIAGAANASAIDVSDFGMSLSQVGAVANLAGAKFADTATAIALLGNAGIKGSDAGTSLKSMFMNLQPTTEKQIALFEELGLATGKSGNAFYDAQGNLKSMSAVSGELSDALKGMTKQQKQATLEVLFGSDGIRAAAILANEGSKGFDKMADSMGKVSAADVAATKMDNFAGSVEMLKGSLETLMIQVGTPLLGMLRGVVDGVTTLLNSVLSLPGPVLEAGTMFLSLLSAGLILVGGIMKVIAVVRAGGLAITLLTGPIGLAIALIAALVAAFIYFYKSNEGFRDFINDIGSVLKDKLGEAVAFLVPLLKQFGEFLVEVFQASLPYIKQFGEMLVTAFNATLPYIKQFIAFIGQLAELFINDVLPVIQDVGETIISSLVGAFDKVMPQIEKMIPAVQDFISAFIDFADAIIQRAQPAIQFIITALGILAGVFISTILPMLIKIQGAFIKVFVDVLGNAIRTALGVIRGALNIISGIMKIFTGILTGDWSKAWEGVKQVLRGAVGIIGSLLRGLLSNAGAVLKGLGTILLAGIKAIPGLLKGAGSLFLAAGKFLIDQFVQGIKNAAGLIEGIASSVWDFVRGLLNGAIGSINAALEFTIDPPGPGSVSVNPPDIPQLAKGGVIKAPTFAWIAEQGQSEAVVPLNRLWNEIARVYRAGQSTAISSDEGSRSRKGDSGSSGQSTRSRLVEGRLYIDPSGRAYIKGVAEDVYDGEERFATAHGRMG